MASIHALARDTGWEPSEDPEESFEMIDPSKNSPQHLSTDGSPDEARRIWKENETMEDDLHQEDISGPADADLE